MPLPSPCDIVSCLHGVWSGCKWTSLMCLHPPWCPTRKKQRGWTKCAQLCKKIVSSMYLLSFIRMGHQSLGIYHFFQNLLRLSRTYLTWALLLLFPIQLPGLCMQWSTEWNQEIFQNDLDKSEGWTYISPLFALWLLSPLICSADTFESKMLLKYLSTYQYLT